MKELTIFLIIILLIFFCRNYFTKQLYLTKIKSTINDKYYYVRNLPDKLEAANILANLGIKCQKLIDNLNNDKYKEEINRLKNNFISDNITENIPGSEYIAYSLNKGEELSICIRDKDNNNKFIDENTIMFVCIHELAHIMSKEIGHTDKFWENMVFLLKEAIKINIYNEIDYKRNPVFYCGMKIDNTPL